MTKEQYELLKQCVKPGDLIFITGYNWISKIIQAGQSINDPTWTNQIIHVGFVDSNMNLQESTVNIKFVKGKLQYANGIQIRPLDVWKNNEPCKWLFIMRLHEMTDQKLLMITLKGEYLKSKNIQYPIAEIVGTLIESLKYSLFDKLSFINRPYFDKLKQQSLTRKNPFDNVNNFYCIAFANHCYESQGLRLIPENIDESRCMVSDGLKNVNLGYDLIFIQPKQLGNYTKKKGQKFDLMV